MQDCENLMDVVSLAWLLKEEGLSGAEDVVVVKAGGEVSPAGLASKGYGWAAGHGPGQTALGGHKLAGEADFEFGRRRVDGWAAGHELGQTALGGHKKVRGKPSWNTKVFRMAGRLVMD